ncbi:uncharacterized protein LOC121390960 [Gigantopelta aegis]|uniref:uncharacterized protein LOC121390960 n=1 Tax=Gigantopelta aegis TaxID=1735272 RepID=UPI001B888DA5|nr:uncharacterized protein LOC121390960 [Gigantopelta aegis]
MSLDRLVKYRTSGEQTFSLFKTMACNKAKPSDSIDLEKLSVRSLKVYLRDRGAHVSGTRPELVKRAKGVQLMKFKPLQELKANDLENTEHRKVQKFTSVFNENLPEPWTLNDNWESDIEKIPFMRTGDLYNYLVLNRNRTFDSNSTNAKRQLRAKVFYEDKHVHAIMYHNITVKCTHCYVKCKVIPSLPTGTVKQKPDYDVWVSLSKVSGNVHAAGCTCSAGEGESCNHIAALLYALVDISTKKKDRLQSSTSTTCKWIQPRKRHLSPQKSQDLVFKKHKFDPSSRTQTVSNKRQNNTSNIQPIDASSLCQKLKQCAPHAAILLCDTSSLNEIEITPESDVPVLHNINFMYGDNINLMNKECTTYFEDYFYSLKCSEADCHIIEENTKRQSKSYQWKVARVGRLTSSNFGTIYKLKDTTPPDNTLKTLLNYTEFQVASVRWGSSHEAAARRVYSKSIQKIHPAMKIMQCGLIVNSLYPHLGSSPDALLNCTHCEQNDGVLEIKCPYKYRFMLPSEAAKDKAFCCELVKNKVQLKKNHVYYFQILGQLAITNRKV